MRRFLVFDLGETLVNFNLKNQWYSSLKYDVIPLMYNKLRMKIQLNISLEEFQQKAYSSIARTKIEEKNMPMRDRIKEYFDYFNIKFNQELLNSQYDAFYSIIAKKAEIYPEVYDVLKSLVEKKYMLGLFSDTPWQCPGFLIENLLKKLKIKQFFSYRLYSGDIGARKPNPQTLIKLLEISGQSRENIVYIGDRDRDIIVCHKLGVPSIHIHRDGTPLNSDFPRPSYRINNLRQILEILPIE
ncbi:MAG: HAD family hydrolase [Promethearchaeota archaeon]